MLILPLAFAAVALAAPLQIDPTPSQLEVDEQRRGAGLGLEFRLAFRLGREWGPPAPGIARRAAIWDRLWIPPFASTEDTVHEAQREPHRLGRREPWDQSSAVAQARVQNAPRATGPRATPHAGITHVLWVDTDDEHHTLHGFQGSPFTTGVNAEHMRRQTTSSPTSSATSRPRSSSSAPTSKPPSSSSSASSASKPPSSSSSKPPPSSSSSSSATPTTTTSDTTTDTKETTTTTPDSSSTPPPSSSSDTTSPSSTLPTSSAESSSPTAEPHNAASVPIGAIIGGAVGGAFVVGALAALLFIRLRRKRRRPRDSVLLMDPDFPIALDPYYPSNSHHMNRSPSLSSTELLRDAGMAMGHHDLHSRVQRAPSVLSPMHTGPASTAHTYPTRHSGYDAYDDGQEYVYAGPDGYYDPGAMEHQQHPAHTVYARPQQGSMRRPARAPSQREADHAMFYNDPRHLSEQYDHNGYYSGAGGYPDPAAKKMYPAPAAAAPAGYPAPVLPAGYYAGEQPMAGPAVQATSAGYYAPVPHPPEMRHTPSTPTEPRQSTVGPPQSVVGQPEPAQAPAPPAPAHVAPEMVVHEEDAGVVLPTTLPPMYRAEWAPATEGAAGGSAANGGRPAKS